MCLRKLFPNWFNQSPVPDPIPDSRKTALLYAINNYPGSSNDLNGCIPDQINVFNFLNKHYPGFAIKTYQDSLASVSAFLNEVRLHIARLQVGDVLLIHFSGHGTQTYDKHSDEADGYDEAICLYDGLVIDDDIGESLKGIPDGATVLLMFDSCFSGTITRGWNNSEKHPTQNRYMPSGLKKRSWKKRRFTKAEMQWIVISGCGEQQTSADAYIDGGYNGAFTYYALKTLKPGMTYTEWMAELTNFLPGNGFDQSPTIEGNEALFNKIVLT